MPRSIKDLLVIVALCAACGWSVRTLADYQSWHDNGHPWMQGRCTRKMCGLCDINELLPGDLLRPACVARRPLANQSTGIISRLERLHLLWEGTQ